MVPIDAASPAPLVVAHFTAHVGTPTVFFNLTTTLWALVDGKTNSPPLIKILFLLVAVIVAVEFDFALATGILFTIGTAQFLVFCILNVKHPSTIRSSAEQQVGILSNLSI